jgi:hypothetical protein
VCRTERGVARVSAKGCRVGRGVGEVRGTKARGESGGGGAAARGEWEETA